MKIQHTSWIKRKVFGTRFIKEVIKNGRRE